VLESSHVAVGAAIASKIPNPFISIPLAFLSHFVFDFVPHWNPSLYTERQKFGAPTRKSIIIIIGDVILSLILGLEIASRFWPDINRSGMVVLACLAAVLPDIVEAPYFFLKTKSRLLEKLIKFQHNHQVNAKLVPGLLTQIATIAVCLYLTLSM